MFSENIIRFFAQHFVSLGCYDRTPGERADANQGQGYYINISCTVISIKDHWFLLTAGHAIDEVNRAIEAGQILQSWHLDDTGSANANQMRVIPFGFDPEATIVLFDEDSGDDYALMPISSLFRLNLEANGIKAFDETAWRTGFPDEFERYIMLGVPTEFIETENVYGVVSKGYAMIGIDRIESLPSDIPVNNDLFYGRLNELPLESIVGMSGGPIFGFAQDKDGRYRYWLVALQSKWYKHHAITVGCYTRGFLDAFDEWFSQT